MESDDGVTEMAKDGGRVIRISGEVEKRLAARGRFGQKYNDLILDLLNEVEGKAKNR